MNDWGTCMGDPQILDSLGEQGNDEKPEVRELRSKALLIVGGRKHGGASISPTNTLFELLNDIVKPLFSKNQHERLTSTGRKRLIQAELPAAATRFSPNLFFDDNKPLWKNTWTTSLLSYIIEEHDVIDDLTQRQKTIEGNFYLLVPSILQMIDDVDILYKANGCRHLYQLSRVLVAAQSMILKRSGLTDVFVEALKNDFSYLPTLTEEEDSIALYKQLYPAYLGLVQARFQYVGQTMTSADNSQKQLYLTLLLRHQLLHSLTHLSTGSGLGSTISPRLSTLLLGQLSNVVRDMGASASLHLQTLVPLLSNIMSDPFSIAAPHMLLAAAGALKVLIEVCCLSLSLWWKDLLRATVTCWLVLKDDDDRRSDEADSQTIPDIQDHLRNIVKHLRVQVGRDFVDAEQRIVLQEEDLNDLFSTEYSLSPR